MELTEVLEKIKERLESEFNKDHNGNRMAVVADDLEKEFGRDFGAIITAYAGYLIAIYRYTQGR
jgi:hypothetical protein